MEELNQNVRKGTNNEMKNKEKCRDVKRQYNQSKRKYNI